MTYSEFLDRYCGCHEDRLYSNGCRYNKCITSKLEKLWKEVRDND